MEGNRLTEKAALRKMEALLVEMDRAENPHDFEEKDIAFHAMVVDAAGSQIGRASCRERVLSHV